jgi:uncharacterized protein YbjT (DUF2867 family)
VHDHRRIYKALAGLGAEVVQGDLNDEASLVRAVEGAWGVFALQNTWEAGVELEEEQGMRLAAVAREHGVKHYVYSSVGSADRKTGIPHFENKWRIEEAIRDYDFPSHTILRPVFFMENWTSPWFGVYGKLAFEQHERLNGQAIDIAGDELSGPEAAEIVSKAAGKPVSFFQVPIEQVRAMSEDFAIMLEWFDRVGYSADIEGNVKKYGIEPTSFEAWAGQVAW